jgi:hypothetical protein
MEHSPTEPPFPAWCLAANIIAERPYGPGGQETRTGTKHFAPGAKVYLLNFFWGMGGEDVTVIGHHRRSHRLVTMTIRSRWLVNWRAELVYRPAVVRALAEHPYTYWPEGRIYSPEHATWMGSDEAKAQVERMLYQLQQWHPTAAKTEPQRTRAPRNPHKDQT